MPAFRRFMFGAKVTPQEEKLDENNNTHWAYDSRAYSSSRRIDGGITSSVGKKLSIAASQWHATDWFQEGELTDGNVASLTADGAVHTNGLIFLKNNSTIKKGLSNDSANLLLSIDANVSYPIILRPTETCFIGNLPSARFDYIRLKTRLGAGDDNIIPVKYQILMMKR